MPWRLIYNPSLNKERGLYPLRARYQGNLDVGFFVAHFSTQPTSNNQPRGPPSKPYWRKHKQTFARCLSHFDLINT